MRYSIKSIGGQPIAQVKEIPANLQQHQIHGSDATVCLSGAGELLLQQVYLNGYGLQYFVYTPGEKFSFLESFDLPVVICWIVIKGEVENKIRDIGSLNFKESQFNIIYSPSYSNAFHLSNNKEVVFARVLIPAKNVGHSLSFFPNFEQFQKAITKSKGALLSNEELFADAGILDNIFKLLHSPFSANTKTFHVNLISEFLVSVLKNASKATKGKKHFSIYYIERIHEAKDLIDTNLPVHLSISEIAFKTKINEQKLKQGFKEIFGIGLYGYLRQQVLEIARIQLEETDKPIKEIAIIANYNSQGNFSSAFKKQFGATPLEWRNKSRQDVQLKDL